MRSSFGSVQAVLDALWLTVRERWLQAIRSRPEDDTRSPVFLVIGEAHNLAPRETSGGLASAVLESLIRIAAEGRKYGLFLILVTQRPSSLHPGLPSQCDSLCPRWMNNRLDLQLVEDSFGYVPEGWARHAMDFKVGDDLLCGISWSARSLHRVHRAGPSRVVGTCETVIGSAARPR